MKKILIINYGNKPLPDVKGGGVESLIQMYISQCKDLDITVISYYDELAYEKSKEYKNVNFIYIKETLKFKVFRIFRWLFNKYTNFYIGNEYIYQCRKKVEFNNFDVIISENGIDFGRYIKKYYNGKLVLHLHNDFLNKHTKNVNKIINSYDEIWALSEFVKHRIIEINKSAKVKVLYNGVDLKLFSNKKNILVQESVKNKYNINSNEKVFIYCGRIVEEKGIKQLILAFNNLCKNVENIKLLVIGSYNTNDSYYKEIKKIANRNVKFTGYIPHEELSNILSIGYCGIAPTVHLKKNYINDEYVGVIEGFNLTVVEYLGMGIPVVISNSGGMPELITDDCGIIVSSIEDDIVKELENALYRVIFERKYNNNNILKRAKMFSKEKYVNTFKRYIGELYD